VKLPPDAYIDPRKITDYLLRMLEDSDKSAFLARAGYTEENPEALMSDIRTQLLPLEAVDLGPFAFGRKYEIDGELTGPSGVTLQVKTIWAIVSSTGQTRFVTLIPNHL
jgi:hypothetical protein